MAAEAQTQITQALEPGPGREVGTAGKDAVYIERTLSRWQLRGDGTLKK